MARLRNPSLPRETRIEQDWEQARGLQREKGPAPRRKRGGVFSGTTSTFLARSEGERRGLVPAVEDVKKRAVLCQDLPLNPAQSQDNVPLHPETLQQMTRII